MLWRDWVQVNLCFYRGITPTIRYYATVCSEVDFRKWYIRSKVCFQFVVSTVCEEWKQPTEQKQPQGVVERSGYHSVRLRASTAHTWMVLGGDPTPVSLSVVANDDRRSERHIMWCRWLDARWLHRTATLMIWTTFLRTEPYEALEVAVQAQICAVRHSNAKAKIVTSRCHCLWTKIAWFAAGIVWGGIRKYRDGKKGRGWERISNFFWQHIERKSPFDLIVSDLC